MISDASTFKEIEIDASEARLAGRFYPPVGIVRAHLLLHGATGVRQRYYAAFARWAASQGVGTLTYDYRDFGASSRAPMKQSTATMATWGIDDQTAAEAALRRIAPEGPLWLLGHSIGGLTFPFRSHDKRVARVTTVGAGFGYYRDHPWSYLPLVLAFWFGVGPLATAVAGYLPGRRILLGADLPAGVYWQWRRWCTNRSFFQPDFGHSLPIPDFSAPSFDMHMITMEDDVVVPPVCVWRYADSFPAGSVRRTMLKPSDYGLKSLRHIEVLSEQCKSAWPTIVGLPRS
ncbi:alpha/beta fold hydrolase [Neorhizobium sp. T7_12]|uniref:alpha/beta hydrolase family protein n=1 Tax=Neorhizobium sp. T7_12 TaxID=2093832 RepID=UPI001FE118EB|nr:alpha/beta fold hydrolase [Neorhizobium sp. T7_12]